MGKAIIATILIFVGLIVGALALDNHYNTHPHSEDVQITEWVSPDGVHYWYQQSGYHAMLAPRYDRNGKLVIDGVIK